MAIPQVSIRPSGIRPVPDKDFSYDVDYEVKIVMHGETGLYYKPDSVVGILTVKDLHFSHGNQTNEPSVDTIKGTARRALKAYLSGLVRKL